MEKDYLEDLPEEDIYHEKVVEELAENDEISLAELGFMIGYLED